uniref:Uncharacterized protein n=1 Tax=Romanomermis culicivorax TaxID=13658 RepID=A0A915JYJ4_ROMCU
MLVGFDPESIMAADMNNFQLAMPMIADSTASSYPPYVQLAFPNGMMYVFETFTATPEDWTALFSLVNGDHTIVISFDRADDWAGIYALLGTQFRTDRQKKNKDPVVKVIHLDAYCIIRNINISPPLYELARQIEVYNAPALFPHNSLDTAEIDHLAEMLIAAFHNVALIEVLPAEAIDEIYPTISQIALPAIMRDEVLSAYQIFLFDCVSSDHGQSFCLGTQPNSFRDVKTLMRITHPKVLTAPKVHKKKKKKQKDECNKLPEVSGDEDPSLQP